MKVLHERKIKVSEVSEFLGTMYIIPASFPQEVPAHLAAFSFLISQPIPLAMNFVPQRKSEAQNDLNAFEFHLNSLCCTRWDV